MLNKRAYFFILSLVLLLFTNKAFANGIPVIFVTTVFHIVFINTVVIIIETILLKRLSRDKIVVWFVIIANLASLFLAYSLTSTTISSWFDNQWFGLSGKDKISKRVFLTGVAVFILLTILIEWPFYHLAQKNNKSWFASLKYSAIINLVTNVPIAIFYLANDLYYDPGD